ncbi:hypothetical protein BAE44_0002532 [Dichanthelium oligosanthes]|uniref:At1g61320/AtMIF1 LRR domain-containing protein n=1 Tax=Dichanthelium oligosanthes TaxID=888268 RepID=A0A1E5WGC3_9POAL|nr:hypothetical protein BAE44_0002532 [Dichanthelium oligosanthes]
MGCLALMSFLPTRRERQRRQFGHRQIQRDGGSIASLPKIESVQCQDGDNSQADKVIGFDLILPEDILRRIHALLPMKDAARAACISRAFLGSWRSRPNLTFREEIFGLNKNAAAGVDTTMDLMYILDRCSQNDITRDFINKIEHILQNHSGIGVKALKLELYHCNGIDSCYIDGWLHAAVTPGIEEFTLIGPGVIKSNYDFPCSVLFDRGLNSIRFLQVSYCAFHPAVDLGCLTSLTQLHLCAVRITTDELELLISKSFSLECLKLVYCDEITRVKIPCLLEQLNSLQVIGCHRVRAVESYAPNLFTFHLDGILVPISFGNPLQVKNLEVSFAYEVNVVSYACTNLLSMVPNVEAVTIHSPHEIDNTPMMPGKFLHLKYLHVCFGLVASSPAYDHLSLISFLDASPSLETFILSVTENRTDHGLVFGEPFHPRQVLGYRHENLKSLKINGFSSERSMVELVYHILENAPSLEGLTLDTTNGAARCYLGNPGKCTKMLDDRFVEARKALLAVRTYIAGRVPRGVKLSVVEPCSRCHAGEIQDAEFINRIRFVV